MNVTPTAKAYSYVRFSSLRQFDGDSLRRQTALRDAYLAKHNLILDDSLNYSDLGVSGFTGKHAQSGGLSQFLDAIKRGLVKPGSLLIVENLDRLTRQKPIKAVALFTEIVEAGVKIVTLQPQREYTADDSESDFMDGVYELMRGHRESKRKSDLGSATWDRKRKQITDKPLTKQLPAWLTISNNKVVPIPESVDVIKLIFKLAIDGHGSVAITKKLNAQGLHLGDGTRRITVWNKPYVARTLVNRQVLGEFQHHTGKPGNRKPIGDVVFDYYPRIISDADFYKVQNGLASRKMYTAGTGRTGKNVANLFTGLITDANDGSLMHVINKDGRRLVSAAGIRGGAKFVSFPYSAFEMGTILWLHGLDVDELVGTQETTANDLEGLEVRLAFIKKRIAQIQEQLTTDDDITPLLPAIATLEKQRKETIKGIEKLRGERSVAVGYSDQIDGGLFDLLRKMGEVAGEDLFDLRTRIKTRIKYMVAGIVCEITTEGLVRTITCTITFRSGTTRKYQVSVKRGEKFVTTKNLN